MVTYDDNVINIYGVVPFSGAAFEMIKLSIKDTKRRMILNGLVFISAFAMLVYLLLFNNGVL